MTHTCTDQTLALAGIFQAASLVERIAKTADAPAEPLRASLHSIFVTDPDSVIDVFGPVGSMDKGLRTLKSCLCPGANTINPDVMRYTLSLIHLAHILRRQPKMLAAIGQRIGALDSLKSELADLPRHKGLITSLARLYLDTISTFRPRIQVTGERSYLQNSEHADCIRAVLLAGIRAAMLWYQVGGRRWQLLFSRWRGPIVAEASRMLLHNW